MTAGLGMITNALTKILGAQVLRDMQTFVAALDTLFGGFRQRAQQTFALLQADGTAFLVVAAPGARRAARGGVLRRAAQRGRMPLAGLVVNRASPAPEPSCRPTRRSPPPSGSRSATPASPTAGLLRLHADRVRIVEREAAACASGSRRAPAGAHGGRAGARRPTCTTSTACAGSIG